MSAEQPVPTADTPTPTTDATAAAAPFTPAAAAAEATNGDVDTLPTDTTAPQLRGGNVTTTRAAWPDAAPPLDADIILTIVCGNTRCHWAIHESYQKDYYPTVFWKTGAVDKWDEKRSTREEWFANFLPPHAFKLLFGKEECPTAVEAIAMFAARKVSMCPVYILSTKETYLENLLDMLNTLPTRITILQTGDFGTEAYEGCGVDRVASLIGAECKYEKPALVIDGGTALTWTCTAATKNEVRGGGIAPGMAMRFKALHAFTGALPDLTVTDFYERVKRCGKEGKPIKLYADNTKDAMITSVLRELALLMAHIVRAWVKDQLGRKKKAKYTICLTGGDADLLKALLTGTGHLLQTDKDGLHVPKEASVVVEKNLIHHGVAKLLIDETPPMKEMIELEKARVNSIGQRIAMKKNTELMRGTIVDVTRGESIKEDNFTVSWDDHTIATLDVDETCVALKTYGSEGETEAVTDRICVLLDTCEEPKGVLQPQPAKKGRSKQAALWISTLLEGKSLEPPVQESSVVEEYQTAQAKRKPASSLPGANKKPRKEADNLPIGKDSILENPEGYVGRRVARFFDDALYFGTVKKYALKEVGDDEEETPLWKVVYDDDDKEEYDITDMVEFLSLYQENERVDPKA